MSICGIIAEYDPLHRGHAWHLREARRLTGAEKIVCALSGPFTQRGMPALLSPHCRAAMALRAGADLALGLPFSFSACEAERFALGGVSVLRQAGADCLCFGAEPEGIPVILPAAELLENPTRSHQEKLHELLAEGLPFPKAQGQAMSETLGVSNRILSLPNTVLGICYARANLRLKAGMRLYPIQRSGDYHSESLPEGDVLPSAAAVRAAILSEQWQQVRQAMPEEAYALLREAFARGQYHPPEALDPLLRWKLRRGTASPSLPGSGEGLENRRKLAENCRTREEMVQAIRSKRYPYARVNRLLTHLLTDTDQNRLSPLPPHAYVLGFRKDASSLLRGGNGDFRFVTHADSKPDTYEMELDILADDLWNLGAGLPFGAIFREKPVIL